MSYVSLGRFALTDDGPGSDPYWCAPPEVTALVDLVPPAQDADPEVNYALMLSDSPLDSGSCHHTFGTGNVSEMSLAGIDREAWESVTGYRPAASTIAEALAEHLLLGSDPTGTDFSKPLTAGPGRLLEVQLGGTVWSQRLSGLNDPLARPVMLVEAEGLATIYRTLGEETYRRAMQGLRVKYDTAPIKDLIQLLFPSGRDDLPLCDELPVQTTKNESFPSNGVITATTQDNTWSAINGTMTATGGKVTWTSFANASARLDYAFGNADIDAQVTLDTKGTENAQYGILVRDPNDGTITHYYARSNPFSDFQQIFSAINGSRSNLGGSGSVVASAGDILKLSASGSSIIFRINGATAVSITNTALTAGLYGGIFFGDSTSGKFTLFSATDNLPTGGPSPHHIRRRMHGGMLYMGGAI